MELKYLKNDIIHYLANVSLSFLVFIFYWKYGFFGWQHLIFVFAIQYSVLPLDDWMEKKRPFPFYIVPLLAYSFWFSPIITTLALLGDLVVNLRVLLKSNNFILERLEGIGNLPIYIIPLAYPVAINNPILYIAGILYLLFADSFHKIGHKESVSPKLMWITGLFFLGLVGILFGSLNFIFISLTLIVLFSLIPFKILKNKFHSWLYSQAWFGLAGFCAFTYFVMFFG